MKTLLCTLSLLCASLMLDAQTINLTPIGSGFSMPLGIEFAPGENHLYIVQQKGRVRMLNTNGVIEPNDYMDLTPRVHQSGGERGLLGLAFHPDYVNNGYVYVNYIAASDSSTRISRFTRSSVNPDVADTSTEEILLTVPQPYPNHNGGCLRFGSDGYLYIGMGDGGGGGDPGNRAQNPQNLLGKILRINVNGSLPYTIPAGNPYAGQTDTLPEIWAMGMRNPWRFSFDRLSGDLWIADVGQGNWEEIDYQAASAGGRNYGWRCYEGNVGYNTSGCKPQSFYQAPVAAYSHGSGNCSVTGGFLYRGAMEGDLYNKYIYVDYCSGIFRETHQTGTGTWTTTILNSFSTNNFTSFGQGHDGELFISDGSSGVIYSIATNTCQPSAGIWGKDGKTSFCTGDSLALSTPPGSGFSYQWLRNGNNIPGAQMATYYTKQAGMYRVAVTNNQVCRDTSAAFSVIESCVTGLQETTTASFVNLYPNPATDMAILQLQCTKPMQVSIKLLSIDGKIFMHTICPLQSGNNIKELSLHGLAPGLYTLQLSGNELLWTGRLMVTE